MKETYSSKKIAFIISVVISIVVTISMLISRSCADLIAPMYLLILVAVCTFVLCYVLLSYFIRAYIKSEVDALAESMQQQFAENNAVSKEEREKTQDNILTKEKESKKEREDLHKLEEYRKQFLANVSHELKTPIFNIQGYLETLIDSGFEDSRINREYVYKAAKNTERLSTIIDDLGTISLIESGKMHLDYSKFNIYELILEVIESLEIKATAAEIKLIFDVSSKKDYMVEADQERIRQVLINLVFNSIKYGNTDGCTTISCSEDNNNILVEVSDNGMGIEEEHLSRLFERFYRVDTNRSREIGGTGLGLAIVKHIIETHEQSVHVSSTSGVGSTFGFTLKKV